MGRSCQDSQAEHIDMRVINRINSSALIEVGPAHSLIP
jgi:hypothetical protein